MGTIGEVCCMTLWRRFCRWLFFAVPLGFLAPHVLHMSLPGNTRMFKVKRMRRRP